MYLYDLSVYSLYRNDHNKKQKSFSFLKQQSISDHDELVPFHRCVDIDMHLWDQSFI